ncbi:MAG: hypothetical protein QXV37_02555 [Candidatus Jordarchaeaceae archaeon]
MAVKDAKAAKPAKTAEKRPKRRIVISTGFEEFSGKLLPITMIVLGVAVIIGSVAYISTCDSVQYWLLFRNWNIIGLLLFYVLMSPLLISRIGAFCFAVGGLMIGIYASLFYFPSQKEKMQKTVSFLGLLLGSVYLLLYSIAWIQVSGVFLFDQVISQIALLGLPINLSVGLWAYFLLIADIIIILLILVSWFFPSIQEDLKEAFFISAAIAVFLLAIVDWTKNSLAVTGIPQLATITLLPQSLFMGEPRIEGAAFIIVGISLLFRLTATGGKEKIQHLFIVITGLVYGIALIHQAFLLWSFYSVLILTIAIIVAVIAGVFIVLNGSAYLRERSKEV